MPGSPGGRATLPCPGARLGRPLGLQACTVQGRAAGSQPGPPSCLPPPGHRAVFTDSPRHGFLIKILIFSTPLSPRFSLEHKQHSACYSGAGHGTERGRHVSLLEDVTSRRGQGHRGGWGWALLCWGTWPAPPRPSTRSRGHSSSQGQRAASGSPHYLERKGPGGGLLRAQHPAPARGGTVQVAPGVTAHSRAGGGIPGTHQARGSLTFGRVGPQPAHPQEDSRDGAGAGGSP